MTNALPVGAEVLTRLRAIAQAAGDEVMAVYAGSTRGWTKEDQTPLTEADLRADAVIRDSLAREFPGWAVLSEESGITGGVASGGSGGGATARVGRPFFLVDPLDGTREFLKRNGEFTVNIALIDAGVAIAGVVLAPALGESYYAARGLGAWQAAAGAARPLQVQRYGGGRPLRIVGSRSHGSAALDALLGALPVPHEFVAVGSSLKFCRVAQGAADVYPRFGPTSQWDTAAAQCVLEAAGGCVLDRGGATLAYGHDRPLRNPEFVALGDRGLLPYFAATGPQTGR